MSIDIAAFRAQFPAADYPQFSEANMPDEVVTAYGDMALCYINEGEYLSGACWVCAWNLMTAHLYTINLMTISGEAATIVKSTTVGEVSITMVPPPASEKSMYAWWLNSTAFGTLLSAKLSVLGARGIYSTYSTGCGAFRAAFR